MFSVICVFNNAELLERSLLASLRSQTVSYEWIPIDNTRGRYTSAAEALNQGARLATQDWLLFAHQDVVLLTNEWLQNAERILGVFRPGGWIGVAGCAADGRYCGFCRDRAYLWGAPFEGLVEVQTVDECLLITRRRSDHEKTYFDETICGWHVYGVDVCCSAIRIGLKNYVLGLPVWHDSPSTNRDGLKHAQEIVYCKHQHHLKNIYTTCGHLSKWDRRRIDCFVNLGQRLKRRLLSWFWRIAGFRDSYLHWEGEVLGSLTQAFAKIACLHEVFDCPVIRADGFVPTASRPRNIIHSFNGLTRCEEGVDCVLIASDLAKNLTLNSLWDVRREWGESKILVVCLHLDDLRRKTRIFSMLKSYSSYMTIATRGDGSGIAIIACPLSCGSTSDICTC
jgi:hypothetical protein